MSHRRSRTTAFAAALLVLSACGSSGDDGAGEKTEPSASTTPSSASPSGSPSPAASSSPEAASVEITIEGDQIRPRTKRVALDRDEPVTLDITSDRAGELHIHSTPEQEIGFEAGTTTKTLRFATPGVIEVEEHESDTLLVQFEVR